ncbi:unnamed protein product [Allacma fusca]|uniref:Uncharacterized protein n=1 Tax=Allacma fusca TaxID=39272 RepID=A0A8J2PS56_9HEXA|nr:unnamed protein product [Allacma fusca]
MYKYGSGVLLHLRSGFHPFAGSACLHRRETRSLFYIRSTRNLSREAICPADSKRLLLWGQHGERMGR